jgi:hypothetical protein
MMIALYMNKKMAYLVVAVLHRVLPIVQAPLTAKSTPVSSRQNAIIPPADPVFVPVEDALPAAPTSEFAPEAVLLASISELLEEPTDAPSTSCRFNPCDSPDATIPSNNPTIPI